jgi:hypothetical protein
MVGHPTVRALAPQYSKGCRVERHHLVDEFEKVQEGVGLRCDRGQTAARYVGGK